MVRLSKALLACCLLFIFLQPKLLAASSATYRQLPVINGRVTQDEYEELPYNQALQRCTAQDCVALKSLVRSFDYLLKLYVPNTMNRKGPPPTPHGPVPIVADVARDPELRAPACKLLATFARNYFDYSVGVLTIELASLISAGHSECLKTTMSVFPRTQETQELVEHAQQLCTVRREPNCSAISLNLHPARSAEDTRIQMPSSRDGRNVGPSE